MLDAQYEGGLHGYTYSREGHPNGDVVAARIDRMERAEHLGVITSSGMAALFTTFLTLCSAGDHIVASAQIYGSTATLLRHTLKRMGVTTTFVAINDTGALDAAIQDNTKAIRQSRNVGNGFGYHAAGAFD